MAKGGLARPGSRGSGGTDRLVMFLDEMGTNTSLAPLYGDSIFRCAKTGAALATVITTTRAATVNNKIMRFTSATSFTP